MSEIKQNQNSTKLPQPSNTPAVTMKSNLADVIFKYPETAEILTDYGLHCVGCFASAFDSIEDASKIHNMSIEEIQEMVDRVNELIETGE